MKAVVFRLMCVAVSLAATALPFAATQQHPKEYTDRAAHSADDPRKCPCCDCSKRPMPKDPSGQEANRKAGYDCGCGAGKPCIC